MEKYVLGIDSGGTKFLIRAMALCGLVLAEYVGPPSQHYQIGEAEAAQRVGVNVDACLSLFGGRRKDCAAIVAAVSGVDSPEDEAVVLESYRRLSGFSCPIVCRNDAEITHYSATGGVGVLVIAGTGSIAFGKNSRGQSARAGGWLFSIFSDEGSGSYIARKALFHYSRYLDGCAPQTPLISLIEQRIGALDRKGLMTLATNIATPPWSLPALSREVNEAAALGDAYADAILRDAAQCTFALADELIRQLRLDEEGELRIAVWGSAIVKSKLHLEYFTQNAQRKYPKATVLVPEKDAADGACRMALDLAKEQ